MAVLLWWPLSPWLSPAAAWFIFFNAVVGAIALMSCTASSEHQPDSRLSSAPSRRRLGRSGSSMLLDRLRSFSIFSVASTGALIDDDDDASAAAASTGSHFYRYGTPEAEVAAASATTRVLAPEQPGRCPEAVTATTGGAATSNAATPTAPAPAEEDHAPPPPAPPVNEEAMADAEGEEEHDESISMDEAYALAQRRRAQAQELASPSPPPPTPPPASTAATATARAKKPAATVAEGVSRRRTKAKETTLVEGKAELNARAELFIRQFREELKLQRLNSILGHAHALRSPTAAAR